MTRGDLSSRNANPDHEALRDAFEASFGDPLGLAPEDYVVWLESRVIAKSAPLTNAQMLQVEEFLAAQMGRGAGSLNHAIYVQHKGYYHQ